MMEIDQEERASIQAEACGLLNLTAVIGETKRESLIYIPSWDNCPPEAEILLKLNDTPVLHRQNIGMVTAGAGLGKTAVLHAAMTTLVLPDAETLGLSAFGQGATIIDTEHDTRLFNKLWQRFMYRCGFSKGEPGPENIRWKNIRAVDSLSGRLSILWEEMAACLGLVVIDGIGDFVADINNPAECTELVYKLSSEAQKNDCGVLLSLHNNPVAANEKARGVLGSELWRKAESALIVTKEHDGVRRITTEYSLGKNRQNSDALSAYFMWSDESKRHVPCDPPEKAETKGKTKRQQHEIMGALRGEYSHKDLVTLVVETIGVKERQARTKLNELLKMGLIAKTESGLYRENVQPHWSDSI